jgi:hypothetical protein
MAKLIEFEVQARLNILVSISVSAHSLEEALEKAKHLSESDFVEFCGDYMDGEFKVTGVSESV